jgi:NCS1 family nucleobase:cation symporter-1
MAMSKGMGNSESWPLLKGERNWSSWGLIWVAVSGGVAAWSYSIGGYVAYYLGAGMGTAAMIAGSLIGMFFVVLAVVPASTKYGIESIVTSIPQFGTRGSIFTIFLQYASIMGWNCLLLILFGKALGEVMVTLQVIDTSLQGTVSVLGTLGSIALSWFFLRRGASTVRSSSIIISILVVIIAMLILFFLITKAGISGIFTAKPIAPSNNLMWNYTVGVEILMCTVLSWWPYVGSIIRMVPSGKQTIWPSMIGMGLPTGVISLIGLYSALVIGNPDPTKWLVEIGGVGFGIIALLFLALANIGTAIVGGYATGIGLRRIGFLQKHTSWNMTTFLMFLPVACVGTFIPDLFMAKIPTFMAFLGVVFAPLLGIQITDYILLRRHQLDVHSLFDKSSKSVYHFWGGVNPAAVAGVVAGFMTYLSLLNPITYEVKSIFAFTTATIPSILMAGVVYFIFTKLIVQPAHKGGYHTTPKPNFKKQNSETREVS